MIYVFIGDAIFFCYFADWPDFCRLGDLDIARHLGFPLDGHVASWLLSIHPTVISRDGQIYIHWAVHLAALTSGNHTGTMPP